MVKKFVRIGGCCNEKTHIFATSKLKQQTTSIYIMEQVHIAYEYRAKEDIEKIVGWQYGEPIKKIVGTTYVWYDGAELCPKDEADERIETLGRIVCDDHERRYRNIRIAPLEEF